MNAYFLIAGTLAFTVGLAHSLLGEILIFRRLRDKGLVPTMGQPLLRERHVRILWASWHVVTVLGWALGAMVLRLAFPIDSVAFEAFTLNTIIIAMLTSSLLVLVATKGMHPGWLGLLAVAVLIGLA
jgi:hypothetical protein